MACRNKALFIVHDLKQTDNHFPVGIGYLASVLEQSGVNVYVICADVYHFSNEYVQAFIKDWKPDIIGIGFLAARFKDTVLPLCKAINKVKDGQLMLGGHCASACPDYIHYETMCDFVFIGEAEGSLKHFSEHFFTFYESPQEREKRGFKNRLYYNWKGSYKIEEPQFADIDDIPFPAWHLFPIDEYARCLKLPGWETGDRTLGIVTSRGCIGKCTFCYRMTKGLRLRSIENVIEEIKQLQTNYGITYFFMQDELFVSSKKRIFEFAEALAKENIRIKYACDSRVNIIDEELLEALKDSGCQYLDYGFESMDDKVLRLMKKGQTSEQNYKAAKLTAKAGIPFNMNILWGCVGDTVESLLRNIQFIEEFDTCKNIRTIRPPTPYPGSELFDYAVEKGLLTGVDDFFNKFTNSDRMTVNFTDMPDEKVYEELYHANVHLIKRYYKHKASELSDRFYGVYYNNEDFRGARHYN